MIKGGRCFFFALGMALERPRNGPSENEKQKTSDDRTVKGDDRRGGSGPMGAGPESAWLRPLTIGPL